MVKASGQIEQDLGALTQQTQAMSDALELLYEGYLKALAEASKRQLVLAAYHLCTQAYPDKFLALSWDQRNQVQQALQKLTSQIDSRLGQQRDRAKKMSRRPQQHHGLEFLQRLLEARASSAESESGDGVSNASSSDSDEKASDESSLSDSIREGEDTYSTATYSDFEASPQRRSSDAQQENDLSGSDINEALQKSLEDPYGVDALEESSPVEGDDLKADGLDAQLDETPDFETDDFDFEMEVPAADQRLTLSEEEDLLSALEGLARRSMEDNGSDDDDQPLVPLHLVKHQVLLEKAIRDVFAQLSEEANELLQKADVMPSFPKALMAAATDARGMGEPLSSVPNVVKMSVRVMQGEAMFDPEDNDDEPDDRIRRAGRKSSGGSSSGRHSGQNSGRNSGQSSDRSSQRSDRRASEEDDSRSRRESGRQFSRDNLPPPHHVITRESLSIEALPELAAISLRLSEVEFSDPTVSAWRSRLRQKLGDLKQLGMRYKKTQRALETAQAEDAWRSSWTVRQDDGK